MSAYNESPSIGLLVSVGLVSGLIFFEFVLAAYNESFRHNLWIAFVSTMASLSGLFMLPLDVQVFGFFELMVLFLYVYMLRDKSQPKSIELATIYSSDLEKADIFLYDSSESF
ncbi:unnamed protein product [Oppiella nova]|uniref:Uncharacterized protein n=1 Tax=Oppiella nova TaxID=334625 RepID=A0A7R9QUK8_9ACAR|nr:unnamed protein product [Oppiella nova]CAG2174935.1 unnamed protein product [Oppiella nova]